MSMASGLRLLPATGNAGARLSFTLKNLPANENLTVAVQCIDGAYKGSSFSEPLSVLTPSVTIPTSSANIYPESNQVVDITEGLTLRWSWVESVNGDFAAGYLLFVGTGESNMNLINGMDVGNSNSYILSLTQMINNSHYNWKVVPYNNAGYAVNCPQWSFDTHADFVNILGGQINMLYIVASWGDYDNDGNLDVALSGANEHNDDMWITKIYHNNGNSTFTDMNTSLSGEKLSLVVWGDYDNDGDLDILLKGSVRNFSSKIYRNDGNCVFTDIHVTLPGANMSTTPWGDYDNDGDLDILLMSGGSRNHFNIYRNDGNDVFSEIDGNVSDFTNMESVVWGDYDNDGDLDVLVSGYSASSLYISKIYRNDGNNIFVDIIVNFPVGMADAVWADYDNDGDLDVVLLGQSNTSNYLLQIFRNDSNDVFTSLNLNIIGVNSVYNFQSTLSLGDYDNDGDLDLFFMGNDGVQNSSYLYRNDGNDAFVLLDDTIRDVNGAAYWGDYDNDGDLDILLAGYDINFNNSLSIYRNDISNCNQAPSPPSNLRTSVVGEYVNFQWNAATDAQTPVLGLNYTIRIGTTPGENQISASMANSFGNKLSPVKGNINSNCSWRIKKSALMNYNKYYWSVQAIDSAFLGSVFAPEQILLHLKIDSPKGNECYTVGDSCSITWSSSGFVSNVLLDYSIDNGINWLPISTSEFPASAGRYIWNTPNVSSDQCLIRIKSSSDSNLYDVSDSVFSIMSPPKPPEGIHITMVNNDAVISWEPVTQTIYDTPIIPDYYLVFHSNAINGTYYYLDWSDNLSVTHRRVGLHSPCMFYQVRAFKNYSRRILDMKSLNLKQTMTEDEVIRIYQNSWNRN